MHQLELAKHSLLFHIGAEGIIYINWINAFGEGGQSPCTGSQQLPTTPCMGTPTGTVKLVTRLASLAETSWNLLPASLVPVRKMRMRPWCLQLRFMQGRHAPCPGATGWCELQGGPKGLPSPTLAAAVLLLLPVQCGTEWLCPNAIAITMHMAGGNYCPSLVR